jgi:hypothetical protein
MMAATPFLLLLAGGATGHTVDAKECRVQLTMPAEPKHVAETHEMSGRQVGIHRYAAQSGTAFFWVMCTYVPGMLSKGDSVEAALDFAVDGLLSSNSATLRSSRSIALQGVAGREVYADAATSSLRVRTYAHTDGTLSVIVMGPRDRLATPEAESFFASLTIAR